MNAYLVSHLGLGDNLIMIGALRFLLHFYEKIYFICKYKHYENVQLFFIDVPNIICVPLSLNEHTEANDVHNILQANYENNDIFGCGFFRNSCFCKITNEKFLNCNIIDKKYTIEFDSLTNDNFFFIENFYKDINLNLTYFYEYFYLPQTKESYELYSSVKNYYIIFIQLKCSDGRTINISNLLQKYLYNKDTIIICIDVNLYDIPDKSTNADIETKYNICEKFIYQKMIYYIDLIKNSDEIYIIDSCFTGIVLPYAKTNQLKTNIVKIIFRDYIDNIII